MITATDLEVRAGARTLLSVDGAALRVQPGDRIGLVGRNGAGKTTTMRILAGEGEPYAGTITRTGEVGYLPQDPREGDLDMLARDRVLSWLLYPSCACDRLPGVHPRWCRCTTQDAT